MWLTTDLERPGASGCFQWGKSKSLFCCKRGFPSCHWGNCAFGEDSCAAETEIVVDWRPNGASGDGCGVSGAQALCCGLPPNASLFLPVDLEDLFLKLPPVEDEPVFTLKHPEAKLSNLTLGALSPFGFVVIDGPPDVVTSFDKRDGSHIELLDCDLGDAKHDHKVHTIQLVCTEDSETSNCDDVHLGGAEGTIVKLPADCGYADHGVVHSVKLAAESDMPQGLRVRALLNASVYALSFDYDFGRVKRAASGAPVYFRIDYGTQAAYWNTVVKAPADGVSANSKRDRRGTNAESTSGSRKEKRFWSASQKTWQDSKFTPWE